VIGVCVPLYREFSPDYQVITSLQPLIIADTHSGSITLAEISPGTARIRSWLGVPLIARDYPLGIITLDKYEANFYTETHAQTAQAYAAQAAIALDNARLYQDLQNRMEALRAAQSQLVQSERMAALGRLMASIAHEINNPLQGVQGFLSLLDEELNYRRRQEKIDFYLKIAGQEIERISNIVHRMREFYRPASYQLPATLDSLNGFYHLAGEDFQDIDLHDTLESVLQLANKKLQHNRIVVERVWEPQLPPVPASLDYLKQVFLNLTLNAIDAMQTEGGTLRVSTALDQALLSGDQPQQVVRIEFSDNGVGIPPEVQARLFEPLISTKEHGTGFGLFTSYQIVAAHHGQITVTSSAGAGTTFIILLPLEQPAA
jgi:two-component system NtrC family sensor kinase